MKKQIIKPLKGDEEARNKTPGNLSDSEGNEIENDSNISEEELAILDAAEGDTDEQALAGALDNSDDEGDPLNEKSFSDDLAGGDLDVPGSEADDKNEEIGEEDEENNNYSLNDDREERDII